MATHDCAITPHFQNDNCWSFMSELNSHSIHATISWPYMANMKLIRNIPIPSWAKQFPGCVVARLYNFWKCVCVSRSIADLSDKHETSSVNLQMHKILMLTFSSKYYRWRCTQVNAVRWWDKPTKVQIDCIIWLLHSHHTYQNSHKLMCATELKASQLINLTTELSGQWFKLIPWTSYIAPPEQV